MQQLRQEYNWVHKERTTVVTETADQHAWWTFAGLRANAAIAHALAGHGLSTEATDLAIRITGIFPPGEIEHRVTEFARAVGEPPAPAVSQQAIDDLKFSQCLPRSLAHLSVCARLHDPASTIRVLRQPVSFAALSP